MLLWNSLSGYNADGTPGACDGNLLCQCTVNHSAAFGLVWQTLLAVMLSIYGTVVLKRNRTPLAIGCFIGITIMMANWTFTTAVQEGTCGGKQQRASLLCTMTSTTAGNFLGFCFGSVVD